MKKIFVIFLIFFLILFTAFIKNSTKRIDDEIFVFQENIRILKKDFENMQLEYEYLSSTEKLLEFQNLYFEDELEKKNIDQIKVIKQSLDGLEIKKLKFFDVNEK
tara:strand:- start:107 stop:421 length:315 start_codon:yes stop_codon:yes gene_type:complete